MNGQNKMDQISTILVKMGANVGDNNKAGKAAKKVSAASKKELNRFASDKIRVIMRNKELKEHEPAGDGNWEDVAKGLGLGLIFNLLAILFILCSKRKNNFVRGMVIGISLNMLIIITIVAATLV